MDLKEIKEWMVMTEGKGGIARRDHTEWLIAEVERLTGENNRMRRALQSVTDCQGVSCGDQETNVYQLAREVLAGAARPSLCENCGKADISCPIYPQETQTCVEYVEAVQP